MYHRTLAHTQGFVGQVEWSMNLPVYLLWFFWLSSFFNFRSPSGKILLTKMARGVKVWSAEVSECILICSDKAFSIVLSSRMVFARGLLIEIRRLKWLDGSLQAIVRILVPFLCHDWTERLSAFLSVEESIATKLVSLILPAVLKVIQTYPRISTATSAAIRYSLERSFLLPKQSIGSRRVWFWSYEAPRYCYHPRFSASCGGRAATPITNRRTAEQVESRETDRRWVCPYYACLHRSIHLSVYNVETKQIEKWVLTDTHNDPSFNLLC